MKLKPRFIYPVVLLLAAISITETNAGDKLGKIYVNSAKTGTIAIPHIYDAAGVIGLMSRSDD